LDKCGTPCKVEPEEEAEAQIEEAIAAALGAATTEQLRDALKSRGWGVKLVDE
jgi:hypothetical protein